MKEQYYFIGEAAGKIYSTLEKKGEMTEAALQKTAAVTSKALFQQALGWLAREERIGFSQKGKMSKVSLLTTGS